MFTVIQNGWPTALKRTTVCLILRLIVWQNGQHCFPTRNTIFFVQAQFRRSNGFIGCFRTPLETEYAKVQWSSQRNYRSSRHARDVHCKVEQSDDRCSAG